MTSYLFIELPDGLHVAQLNPFLMQSQCDAKGVISVKIRSETWGIKIKFVFVYTWQSVRQLLGDV